MGHHSNNNSNVDLPKASVTKEGESSKRLHNSKKRVKIGQSRSSVSWGAENLKAEILRTIFFVRSFGELDAARHAESLQRTQGPGQKRMPHAPMRVPRQAKMAECSPKGVFGSPFVDQPAGTKIRSLVRPVVPVVPGEDVHGSVVFDTRVASAARVRLFIWEPQRQHMLSFLETLF